MENPPLTDEEIRELEKLFDELYDMLVVLG